MQPEQRYSANRKQRMRACVALVMSLNFTFGAQRVSGDTLSPEQVVHRLTSLQHGLAERMMDDETKSLLKEVSENPTAYVQPVANVLQIPEDDNALGSDDTYVRMGTALGLARLIGPREAGKIIRNFFDTASRRLAEYRVKRSATESRDPDAPRERAYRNVVFLRNQSLEVLGEFNDPYAVRACITAVETERKLMTGDDVLMLQYLEKISPLRPDIRPKLEEMYNSPDSPLRNHPQLLRVLEAIDKAAAEKKRDRGGKKGERKTTPDP